MKIIVPFAIAVFFTLGINAQQNHETGLDASQKKSAIIKNHQQAKEYIEKASKCNSFTSYLASGLQVDTSICQYADSNATLVNSSMWITLYDVNGNLSEDYVYYWNDSVWAKDFMESWTFSPNGQELLLIMTFYDWPNNTIVMGYKDSSVYDANNLLIERYYADLDILTMSWNIYNKTIFTYNSDTLLIEDVAYLWDGANWGESYKNTYSYDSIANVIEEVYYIWDSTAWIGTSKTEYAYNTNNQKVSQSSFIWNSITTSWGYTSIISIMYDMNGKLIETISHSGWIDSTTWSYMKKDTLIYDNGGYLIESTSFQFHWDGASWDSTYKYITIYSENLTELYHYKWVDTAWNLYAYCDNKSYIIPTTGISETINNNISILLYPNPMNTETVLNIENFNGEPLSLVLYNNIGKQVGKIKINSTHTIIVRNSLSQGIYFYQLMGEQKMLSSGKLVVN